MKKSNLAGWKDVFSFTLVQTMKSKAFLISYIILITLSLISMPLVNKLFSNGNEDVNAPSPIKKVYVYNNTSLQNIDYSKLLTEENMSHIVFETAEEKYDALSKKVDEEERDSVILTITENESTFSLNFLKARKGPVKESHIQALGDALAKQFQVLRINTLGITDEQNAMLNAKITTSVSAADVNGEVILKEDTSISMAEYWFIYGILFFVLMANMLSSTQIATSIITEKSTRVVEYLLITVKPLALMVGKVIAMLFATLLQMVSMVIALFVSNQVISGKGSGGLEQFLPKDIFQNLNIINIIFCFILIMLGMIFYATLAGLAGATVSRMEELNEGLTLFTFTNLIGLYIGLGASSTLVGAGINPFVTFAFLFPLSSPFILPGAILIGKATLPLACIAIVLELIFIILLFRFVAKVYETLILHNGNKIKVKELIHLSKTV